MTGSEARAPLPVTVVSGFLGAGKTTLVNHLLRSASDRRVGVLVNDFGDVSIDADLVVARSEDVVSLANGCICCSLRSDMNRQIMALAEERDRPEHLIIEASGISDPGTILQALLELERFQVIRLDGVITVVDASEAPRLRGQAKALAERQLLAADLLVITKTDLVKSMELRALDRELAEKTPAKRIKAHHGEVPPDLVLGLEGGPERIYEHDPERPLHIEPIAQDHEWTTWRFRTTVPVVFKALVPILRELPEGIFRAKGFLHLIERPGDRLALHLAGRRVQIRTVGLWGRTLPRSELVLVGTPDAIDPDALAATFDACLEGRAEPGERPPQLVGWTRD